MDSLTSNDGEFTFDPIAPYVLSHPDDDWCYAIVRTEDGEVMGTDGWQQMGVVEDATFTRDLAWIIPELNRLAKQVDVLRTALAEIQFMDCCYDSRVLADDALETAEVQR